MTDKSKPNVPESEEASLAAIEKIRNKDFSFLQKTTQEQAVSNETQDKDKETGNLAPPPDMKEFLEENLMLDVSEFLEKWEEMGFSIEELMELIARDPELKSLKIGQENKKRLLRLLQSMINMYKNLEKCEENYKDGKPQEQNDIKVLHQNLTQAIENIDALKQESKQDSGLDKLLTGKETGGDAELIGTAVGGGLLDELIDLSEKVVDVEQEQVKQQGLER